jgi:hypothetical protein
VELYKFFWGALAWIATFAVLWPINVPVIALAYKIQHGARPISIEREELWYRSFLGAGMLALLTAGAVLVDYFLVDLTGFPAGPIHLVIFAGYVAAAAWLMFIAFAYTDLLEGLGIFTIYVGLPVFLLFVINAVLGIWNWPLSVAYDYLKTPE